MLDRVPTKPGRVLITPEDGSAAFYATMTRADEPTQEGNPLNKITLLRDATAALFDFDAQAVPDDIFRFLGKYNQHWWSVLHGEASIGYLEKLTEIDDDIVINDVGVSRTIQYSKEISIDQSNGSATLVGPVDLELDPGKTEAAAKAAANTLAALAPVYITNTYENSTQIYYIPEGATIGSYASSSFTIRYYNDDGKYGMCLNGGANNSACSVGYLIQNIPAGEVTYEYSADRNAYPDGGTVDGLTYKYLGIPFDNAVNTSKFKAWSYTGTGLYGADNPCILTFDFAPKLILLISISGASEFKPGTEYWTASIYMDLVTESYVKGVGFCDNRNNESYPSYLYGKKSSDGRVVSWYNTNKAVGQCNSSGVTYYGIAIG